MNKEIVLPKFKANSVRRLKCFDYDKKEFAKYLELKSKRFKGFTTQQLTKLVGNDMNVIEKIFSKEKRSYTIEDVKEEVGKFSLDSHLENLDKC